MPKWKSDYDVFVSEIEPALCAVTTQWEMAHGRKQLHAYILRLPNENLLFHGPDRVAVYKHFADEFNGISRHILSHHADASPACQYVANTLGAKPYVHIDDAVNTAKRAKIPVDGNFLDEHQVADGLKAIPLPGHSSGFTVYIWQGSRGRYLFGGDIIFTDPKGWTAFFDHKPYEVGLNSLKRLRDLDVDYLLLNESLGDVVPPVPFARGQREQAVSEAIDRVCQKYKLKS